MYYLLSVTLFCERIHRRGSSTRKAGSFVLTPKKSFRVNTLQASIMFTSAAATQLSISQLTVSISS